MLGMFVHGFDGPWLDHPFWLTRFRLTKESDLARIRDSAVKAVVIDEARGLPLPETMSDAPAVEEAGPRPAPRSTVAMQHARSFDEEQAHARMLVKHSTGEMKRLFAAAHDTGAMDIDVFVPIVDEVMASVSRNRSALIAITRLKKRDEYTYVHSLAVSALMTSFARSLGMSDAEVFELGLAGLLHDIGKMVVPDRVLNKPDSLTDEEFALVRTHPEQGYLLLSVNAGTQGVILDVCRHHHERMDGKGYPFGLKGEAISRAARIAAICDVYDALTSNRPYKTAWNPEEAIVRMGEGSGHFDRALLFAFMKAIGVYPPGTLVRMRSNRLAITLSNGRRASRPRVRAFFCTRDRVPLPLEDIVVEDDLAHDQIVGEEYPLDWGIAEWPLVAEQLIAGRSPRLLVAAAQ